MQIISVSHETAPLSVRERFALTREKQLKLMRSLYGSGICSVVICTCNRFEVCTSSDSDLRPSVMDITGCTAEELERYARIKTGRDAAEHLFKTAAGLKSMVLGEDQILGQIKRAFEESRERGFTDSELNTFFRLAVTSAKRIKTETLLSATPVSMAGIGLKAAKEALGGKISSAFIIGAGGKTGSIILKDLAGACQVTVTVRRSGAAGGLPEGTRTVSYTERYKYIDEADLIVSATSAPHRTLERGRISLKTRKKRVFLDMAVPPDIDMEPDENTVLINVDMLRKAAEENNLKKADEAKRALPIIEKYIDEYYGWLERKKLYEYKNRNKDKSSGNASGTACNA